MLAGVDAVSAVTCEGRLVGALDVLNDEFRVKVCIAIAMMSARDASAVLTPRHFRLRTETTHHGICFTNENENENENYWFRFTRTRTQRNYPI